MLCFPSLGRASVFESNYAQKSDGYTLSLLSKAYTANAGGQDVYGLKLAIDDRTEYTLFANQYLITGAFPLTGLIYSKRLVWCPRSCVISSFIQTGIGISSAGPLVEFTWSLTPLWVLRIDISSHYYFFQIRPMQWSYPLWFGLSLPF